MRMASTPQRLRYPSFAEDFRSSDTPLILNGCRTSKGGPLPLVLAPIQTLGPHHGRPEPPFVRKRAGVLLPKRGLAVSAVGPLSLSSPVHFKRALGLNLALSRKTLTNAAKKAFGIGAVRHAPPGAGRIGRDPRQRLPTTNHRVHASPVGTRRTCRRTGASPSRSTTPTRSSPGREPGTVLVAPFDVAPLRLAVLSDPQGRRSRSAGTSRARRAPAAPAPSASAAPRPRRHLPAARTPPTVRAIAASRDPPRPGRSSARRT
jgi:hypothetical protein